MKAEKFNEVVEERISKIKSTLVRKAAEYSSDDDRLHNFKVAARINGETPEKALWGMMSKHLVSVIDIISGTSAGKLPNADMRDEKIGDAINYLILLEALLIEKSPPEALVVEGTCAELRYKTVDHVSV